MTVVAENVFGDEEDGQREKGKRSAVAFSEEQWITLKDYLKDNELMYNKQLMDYKDPNKVRRCGTNFVRK